MGARKGRLVLYGFAAVLMLILVALVGCAEVEVLDTTPVSTDPDPSTDSAQEIQGQHDLAVLAVDFDPPLDYEQLILLRQEVTLLVAIENTGTNTEHDVVVLAQLSTPEDPDLVLMKETQVASIAPGEIQIVRFPPLNKIPYHETYHLEVIVKPVEGEKDYADNGKAFEIQIHQE